MKLIDLNILLYAINEDSPHHEAIRAWWQEALSGDESLGLPYGLSSLDFSASPPTATYFHDH